MLRTARALAPLAALALFAVSCGEPPRRTPTEGGAGSNPTSTTTAGTTDTKPVEDGPISFTGTVRLMGATASAPEGAAVYVNLKPRGQMMPVLSQRVEVAEAVTQDDGTLLLNFAVDGSHAMMVQETLTTGSLAKLMPGATDFDLEAVYDPTGGLTDPTVRVRQSIPVDGFQLDDLVIEVGG